MNSICSGAATTSSSMDPALRWLAIGLQLSTLQLFLAHPFLLPCSARCGTWLTASWHTKRPTIIWTMRPIGLGTFPRKADRSIGYPRPRVSVIRGLLRQCDWILGFFAELMRYPRCGMCLDHRSSPRRARFWCVGGVLRAQRWCSISRSAGECVRSQRPFPGWFPELCRWC